MADGCKLPRLLLETAGSNCGCQRRIQQLEGTNHQDSLWLLFFVLCLVSGTLLPGLCCWDFAAGGDSFFFLFLSSRLFVRALPREKKKKGTTPEIKKKKKRSSGTPTAQGLQPRRLEVATRAGTPPVFPPFTWARPLLPFVVTCSSLNVFPAPLLPQLPFPHGQFSLLKCCPSHLLLPTCRQAEKKKNRRRCLHAPIQWPQRQKRNRCPYSTKGLPHTLLPALSHTVRLYKPRFPSILRFFIHLHILFFCPQSQ